MSLNDIVDIEISGYSVPSSEDEGGGEPAPGAATGILQVNTSTGVLQTDLSTGVEQVNTAT